MTDERDSLFVSSRSRVNSSSVSYTQQSFLSSLFFFARRAPYSPPRIVSNLSRCMGTPSRPAASGKFIVCLLAHRLESFPRRGMHATGARRCSSRAFVSPRVALTTRVARALALQMRTGIALCSTARFPAGGKSSSVSSASSIALTNRYRRFVTVRILRTYVYNRLNSPRSRVLPE